MTALITTLGLITVASGGHGRPPAPLRWLSAAELHALMQRPPRPPVQIVLQRIVMDLPPPTDQASAVRRGVAIEFEVPKIWVCASEKVAEIERLAR